jgi:aldose sugar dehydrogenase
LTKYLKIIFVIVSSLTLFCTVNYYLSVNAEKFIKDDNLKLELVAEDLKTPISMGFLGPNDLLVLEKNGKVKRIIDKKTVLSPILDITSIVKSEVERGLLGIAISEGNGNDKDNIYNKDFNIYLLYTENTMNSEAVNNHCKSEKCEIKDRNEIKQYMNSYNKKLTKDEVVNKLYKYKFKDDKLVNPELLLRTPVDGSSSSILHIGGAITVGPDNNVYLTSGDGTICFSSEECEILLKDGPLRSQTANIGNGIRPIGSGGILHVNVNDKMTNYHGIFGSEYPLNIYYAYGIRNSFGIDFDPVTGYLWDTENGPAFGDEINLVKPGFNSGWAKKQGVWPIVMPSQLAPDPPLGKERGYDFSNNPQIDNNSAICDKLSSFDKNLMDELEQGHISDEQAVVLGEQTKKLMTQSRCIEYESFVDFNGKGMYSDPEFTWNDPVGVTSIEFFNSDKLGKEYENDMFVGTFNGGFIYNFDLNKDRNKLILKGVLQDQVADNNEELQDVIFGEIMSSITDLETGPDGYLYVLAKGEGKIWRIVPSDTGNS